jgi:hypothetical protein
MKIKKSLSALLSMQVLLSGCAISTPKRDPSGMHHMHAEHDPLGLEEIVPQDKKKRVTRYRGLMKAPPIRYLVTKVAEGGLALWVKKLPLAPDVRERVLKNIHSDKFSKDLVPFLFAVKDLYIATKKYKKRNFKNYILEQFEKDSVPGLEHSLFSYEEPKKVKEKSRKSASVEAEYDEDIENKSEKKDDSSQGELFASVITILDAMILQDPNFSLNQPPKRTEELTIKVTPHIQKILDSVLSGMEPGGATYDAVHAIASDPQRVKAASASLIDAIHIYAYKHYNMFSQRYEHKQKLHQWFQNASEQDIVKYLSESQNRKYAVHVMVDGLQGSLMESLSLADSSAPFLTQTFAEYKNAEQFKPKTTSYFELKPSNMNFLEHVMQNDSSVLKNENYLPFFKSLYRNHANSVAKQGISTTPTISVRNIPIIQTGATVAGAGGTGLPNFHFVDRKKDRAFYFFGNDAILLNDLTQESGMKTIAQRLPRLNSLNCSSTYEAGYDWSIDPMVNLMLGEKMRDFGEILCVQELENRIKNEKKVSKLRERYLKLVYKDKSAKVRKRNILADIAQLENETIPEYLAFYNPWPDHFAHFKGPFSDEIISPTGELNRLDFWLKKLTQLYQDAGIYNKTLFSMAGDHGLAPVKYSLNPEKAVFGSLAKEGINLKISKISSDEGEGPKLSDHVTPPSQRGYDVIVASTAGGNHMMDFFIGHDDSFKVQPVYKDLINYQLHSGQTINVIDEILNRLGDTLDYMVVREEESSIARSATRVLSKKSGKVEQALIFREGNKVLYQSEDDLLEISKKNPYVAHQNNKSQNELKVELYQKCMIEARKDQVQTWCDEDEWRDLTAFTPRPDSINQLARLYDTDLAGTVNVFPARYIGYNTKVPGRHAGELYEEKDAFVGYWGAGQKSPVKLISEVNGSSAVTIYEYLSGKQVEIGKDGFGYRSLFERARKKK